MSSFIDFPFSLGSEDDRPIKKLGESFILVLWLITFEGIPLLNQDELLRKLCLELLFGGLRVFS